MQDNNIPQIGPGLGKDESGDPFSNQNAKMLDDRKNVTAQAGHTVYLHCPVELIGDKMVSGLVIFVFEKSITASCGFWFGSVNDPAKKGSQTVFNG